MLKYSAKLIFNFLCTGLKSNNRFINKKVTERAIHHYAAKCAMSYIGFRKGDFFSAFLTLGAIGLFQFVAVAADFCCYFLHLDTSVDMGLLAYCYVISLE